MAGSEIGRSGTPVVGYGRSVGQGFAFCFAVSSSLPPRFVPCITTHTTLYNSNNSFERTREGSSAFVAVTRGGRNLFGFFRHLCSYNNLLNVMNE